MFDDLVFKRLGEATADACAADLACATQEQLSAGLREVQAAMDALAGVHARLVSAFEAMGGHERDGCARVGVWLRRELRLTSGEVRARVRAAEALAALDQVRGAADAGQIRPEHVTEFGHGIRKIGAAAMREAEDLLLPVAREADPLVLRAAIDHLHHAIDPDDPDAGWAKAQEKQDITCSRAGYGYDVRGFLDTDTGAKLAQILKTWTKPLPAADGDTAAADGADADGRPVARRRVEGLNSLLTDYLGGGLPMDKGIRPHLNVTVDYATLLLALRGDRTTPTATPATLAGFGVIGRDLLARLACDSALTVLLTNSTNDRHRCTADHTTADHCTPDHHNTDDHNTDDHNTDANAANRGGEHEGGGSVAGADRRGPVLHRCGCPVTPYVHVLDVGRTERIATPKQRLAVLIAQGHRCATPGCSNTHLEIHHIVSWLDGGRTDMDNLVGLCTSCHTLLHRGLINCRADGHGGALFSRKDRTPIPDVRRRTLVAYAEQLSDHVSAIILRQQAHGDGRRPPARTRDHDDGPDDDSPSSATPPFWTPQN